MPSSTEVLREALDHPDTTVASSAIAGMGELLRVDPVGHADRLVKQARISPWPVVAAVAAAAQDSPKDWIASLNATQQDAVLATIVAIPGRWNWAIESVVGAVASHRPLEVLRSLALRYGDQGWLPKTIHSLPQALAPHANALVEWISEAAQTTGLLAWKQRRIFALAAGNPTVSGASEAISAIAARGNKHELAFLAEALIDCEGFALDRPDLVTTLIEAFNQLDASTRDECRAALRASARNHGYFRQPGAPAPALTTARDQASALAENADMAAAARAFYAEVAADCQAQIDRDLASDEAES